MDTNADQPIPNKEDQWTSYCEGSISQIAKWISRQLETLGVNAYLGDTFIQASGFNIRFFEKLGGCEAHVYIFKESKDTVTLRVLWQYMVDKGLVWGGRYKKKKELPTKSDSEEIIHPQYERTKNRLFPDIIVKTWIAAKEKRVSMPKFREFTFENILDYLGDTELEKATEVFTDEIMKRFEDQSYQNKKKKHGKNPLGMKVGDIVDISSLLRWTKKRKPSKKET